MRPALALIGLLSAAGCTVAGPTHNDAGRPFYEEVEVAWGVDRFVDPEYGVVCYGTIRALSCLPLPERPK